MYCNANFDLGKLSDKARIDNMLEKISTDFFKDFGIIPYIGVEIEFYLKNDDISGAPFTIKKEKGKFQYEIDLDPTSDLTSYVSSIETAKSKLKSWRNDIDFSPKPFQEDYGNSMHFHVNFLNRFGENHFDDLGNLHIAASALCHFLISHFAIFAPEEDCYKRFDHKFMAPTCVSYGGNNRTVAIRIPSLGPKRLEHRVSSPTTDSYLAIYYILNAIYSAMQNPSEITEYNKIHGNAFDEQYRATKFPSSLEDAYNKLFS
ncbi:MAG: glutamine synthetase [Rickettsiaceae bacterium]|nr:glutamine synthetase [Rickettsiaceae bacterium]